MLLESGDEGQAVKVETVQRWPVPRNLTDVQAFLGLCSYRRRFIADFATIAAPLYELQHKNVRFHWSKRQNKTFDQLKQKLISAPVLDMPRDDCTYYVDRDASEVGLGAVLS